MSDTTKPERDLDALEHQAKMFGNVTQARVLRLIAEARAGREAIRKLEAVKALCAKQRDFIFTCDTDAILAILAPSTERP